MIPSAWKTSSLLEEAKELGIQPLTDIADDEAMDILTYIEELEKDAEWEPVKKSSVFEIKRLRGTKYDANFPLGRIHFDFQQGIPLDLFLRQLLVGSNRTKWDTNVKEYELLEGSIYKQMICYTRANVMQVYKGDFVERKFIGTHKNCVVIVSRSIEYAAAPVNNENSRGKTCVGLHFFYEEKGQSKLKYFNQTNPNSRLAEITKNLGTKQLELWCSNFKKSILNKLTGSDVNPL